MLPYFRIPITSNKTEQNKTNKPTTEKEKNLLVFCYIREWNSSNKLDDEKIPNELVKIFIKYYPLDIKWNTNPNQISSWLAHHNSQVMMRTSSGYGTYTALIDTKITNI